MKITGKTQKPLSPEAKMLVEILSKKEKRLIDKRYPIRADRDEMIRKLWHRGVKGQILAEVSGLTTVSISKIVNKKGAGTK